MLFYACIKFRAVCKVKMYEAMQATTPDKELIRLLLESALTVTIQVYTGGIDVAVGASLRHSESLRRLPTLADSFLTFTRKLYTLAPGLQQLSLAKQAEKVNALMNKSVFTFNGCKVDRGLLSCAQIVMKNLGDSEEILTRLSALHGQVLSHSHARLRSVFKHGEDTAKFILSMALSLLNRGVIGVSDFNDEKTETWCRAMSALHELLAGTMSAIKVMATSTDDSFIKVLDMCDPSRYDRAKVDSAMRKLSKEQRPMIEILTCPKPSFCFPLSLTHNFNFVKVPKG